jgi:serine/threonine protein kinase
MPLYVGERLGPCEILAPIGAGGMGEVYRARDTKPDRDVAIKVLPAPLAKNSELSATQSKWPMHSKLRMKKESFIAP